MPWEVLAERQLLDLSPWLKVAAQTIRLPNGTILPDYILAPSREFSMVLAVTPQGRVLLVRQYKHGLGAEAIELPAGYLDSPAEPPLDCARRELREETGYEAAEWTPLGSFALDSNRGPTRCYFFLATGLRRAGEPHLDPSESLSVFEAEPQEVLELLVQGRIVCIACAGNLLLGLLRLGYLRKPGSPIQPNWTAGSADG
jgi:ADP-ribose pyrophosphatase